MSSAEFVEWQAYQRLEGPLGPERDDWRYALIASTIVNVNRTRKSPGRPTQASDFIPDWAEAAGVAKVEKSPEQVAAIGEAWADRLESKVKALGR